MPSANNPPPTFFDAVWWALNKANVRKWLVPKSKREAALYAFVVALIVVVYLSASRNNVTVNVYENGEKTTASVR